MRALPAALLLFALSLTASAHTYTISRMSAEGQIATAELTIDDLTGHVTALTGTDFAGHAYRQSLVAFATAEFEAQGPTMYMVPMNSYWYYIGFGDDGVVSAIGRYGGPGYSSAVFTYRVAEPAGADADDDAGSKSHPRYD